MSEKNNNSSNQASIVGALIVIVFVLIGYLTCCNSEPDPNAGRDPNGFLGYSDDFWEWLGDQ